MDMRTIEKIEYGPASAVRVPLDMETVRELSERYIAFDTETTGLDPDRDRIVELGVVVFEKGIPAASFQSYVNPGICIPAEVSVLNHITNEMLKAAPLEQDVYPRFMKFLGDAAFGKTLICCHVAAFDLRFLCKLLDQFEIKAAFRFVYTRELAAQIPELKHHSLAAVADHFGISHENAHHAKEDALTSGQILTKMLERYKG